MQVGSYQYIAQERIVWGRAAGEAVVAEADRLGAQRVFIIASRTLNRTTDVVNSVGHALGRRLAGVFDGCQEHVPRETVIAAVEAVRAAGPDLIVSMGGGTVIDTAKVVLLALAEDVRTVEGLDGWHLSTNADGSRHVPEVACPPIRQIAVPTTLSGAEYSCLGGVSDTRRQIKHGFYSAWSCPVTVILDPAATLSTPDWLWLSTGIRAVDHAVESLCSVAPSPLVDACALRALSLLQSALPINKRTPADLAMRQQALQGAWLASQGILRVDYGASHGIGHSLGAVTGVSHGYTSCVLLPAVLRWNREQAENRERQRQVAVALGRADGDAALAVEALIATLALPTRLRDLDVGRECFAQVADGALDNLWVKTNPRAVKTRDDVVEILESAY